MLVQVGTQCIDRIRQSGRELIEPLPRRRRVGAIAERLSFEIEEFLELAPLVVERRIDVDVLVPLLDLASERRRSRFDGSLRRAAAARGAGALRFRTR